LSPLILKRASDSRPSGQWRDDDYDVLADGAVVGCIMLSPATPAERPWMWASGHNGEGAQAGDLPMQAPAHYHIAFILKTARALGLDMPPMLLARASQLAHNTVLRHMQICEVTVRIFNIERNCSRGLGPAAPNFCDGVFESMREIDSRAVLVPRYRVTNRFSARLDDPGHLESRSSSIDIDVELNSCENRIVHLLECR
jgi:hypothetical protein